MKQAGRQWLVHLKKSSNALLKGKENYNLTDYLAEISEL